MTRSAVLASILVAVALLATAATAAQPRSGRRAAQAARMPSPGVSHAARMDALMRDTHGDGGGSQQQHLHASGAARTIQLRNGVVDVAQVLSTHATADTHHGASKSFLFAAAPATATRRLHGVSSARAPLRTPFHASHNAAARAMTDMLTQQQQTQSQQHTSLYTTYVVHFKGPLTERAREDINAYLDTQSGACTAQGDLTAHRAFALALGDYVPHNTHLVTAAANAPGCVRALRDAPYALFVDELHGEFKVDERLLPPSPGVSSRLMRVAHAAAAAASAAVSAGASDAPAPVQVKSAPRPQYVVHLAHDRHALSSAARDDLSAWHAPLNALTTSTRVSVRRYGSDSSRTDSVLVSLDADVNASDDDRRAVLAWLAARTEVLWIEPRARHVLHNRFAKYTVQSDQYGNATITAGHGLNGQNQIVSVGDTGADTGSCFFADPAYPTVNVRPAAPNFAHRKIVYYDPVLNGNENGGDTGDDVAGHGTHVAGSIAGTAVVTSSAADQTWLSQYNGMATSAKLAVFDFKIVGNGDLNVPDAIVDGYYANAYTIATSRINSNSWGSQEGAYDYYALETDRFVHEHQDFLPVFAAGNYGENGFYSLSSPGVAKNVLTVGATLSSPESWRENGRMVGLTVLTGSGAMGAGTVFEVAGAKFGSPLMDTTLPASMPLVIADPPNACTGDYSNTAASPVALNTAVTGKAVLIQRGTCTFYWKFRAAELAGAVLVIVYDSSATGPLLQMDPPMADAGGAAAVFISQANGQSLAAAVAAANPAVTLSGTPVPLTSLTLNSRTMADFSSRGPTPDGRLKPDVSAPGSIIISARSAGAMPHDPVCGSGLNVAVLPMEGTSMATPITAGSVALVRQYYTDGYYPSGQANASNTIWPSAALLKATMIASTADQMYLGEGTVSDHTEVLPPPSIEQGFGRVLLEAGLVITAPPVSGQAPTPNLKNHNLWVTDVLNDTTAGGMSTGALSSYCFYVTPTALQGDNPLCTGLDNLQIPCYRPFKATLVWSDAPASAQSSVALVNNLDLSVVSRTGVWLGNEFTYQDPANNNKAVPAWDYLNNVEQVTLNGADPLFVFGPAFYTVTVRGANVPVPAQGYALVVTGNFEARPLTDCQAAQGAPGLVCPNACSLGKGNCSAVTGVCACNGDYTGADCSQKAVPLTRDTSDDDTIIYRGSSTAPLLSNAWTYFYFDISANDVAMEKDIQVTLTRGAASGGDPDLYLAFNAVPTMASYLGAATACDTCRGATGSSSFVVSASQLQVGRYRAGVHGYCCDDVLSFSIEVTTEFGDGPGHAPTGTVVWTALLAALGCIGVAMGGVWCWRRYKTRAGIQGGAAGGGQDDIPEWARGGGGHRLGADSAVGHGNPRVVGVVTPAPPVAMSGGYRLGHGGEAMEVPPPAAAGGAAGGGAGGRVVIGPSGPMSLVPPQDNRLVDRDDN